MHAAGLSQKQIVILAAVGAVLWYVGTLCIRLGAPYGLFAPDMTVPLYLLTIPVIWGSVRLACRAARLTASQAVAGTAVSSASAMLLDGAAFAWAHGLYGEDPAVRLAGAAWLLWAVGAGFVAAFLGVGLGARTPDALTAPR